MTAVNREARCSSRISRWIALTSTGSRPVVGSSKKTISGSVTSARAIATRLRMPPETSSGYFAPIPASPTRSSAMSTRLSISGAGRRSFSRSGKATFSRHVMESNRAPPWNTTP